MDRRDPDLGDLGISLALSSASHLPFDASKREDTQMESPSREALLNRGGGELGFSRLGAARLSGTRTLLVSERRNYGRVWISRKDKRREQ